jgi:hypothetical protein
VTPSTEIYFTIEVQVRVFIILTGTVLGFSYEKLITSPLISWPFIIPLLSVLYLRRGGIQLTVSYISNRVRILSGVAVFIRS